MPHEVITQSQASSRRGWVSRLFGGGKSTDSDVARSTTSPRPHLSSESFAEPGSQVYSELSRTEIQQLVRGLIADERYAFVLLADAEAEIDDRCAGPAWSMLDRRVALIPAGTVPVYQCDGSTELTEIAAFYLDRCSVTNEQFSRFVLASGYESLEIWPRDIWPSLIRFVDQTGKPGPRTWQNGKYPAAKADHPVTGVCWYEAYAYAKWVGKRLPTAAEWQKAAGWPEQLSGGSCNRYPWGDLYSEGKANLYSSGLGDTVPVVEFRQGSTPNGIYQMTGNVWEWLNDPLETIPCRPDETFQSWKPLKRIVGGAYDTYFHGEAANHFITGQPELDRRDNIGFRCAVSASRLRRRNEDANHDSRNGQP